MYLSFFLIPIIFLIILLLPPIEIKAEKAKGERGRTRIIWLFGLIEKEIFPEMSPEPLLKKPKEEPLREGHDWSGEEILSIIKTQGLTREIKGLLKNLAHAIRISCFEFRIRLGLEDPADTGLASGFLWSAAGYLQSLYPIRLEIEPSFFQEAREVEGQCALRIWPALAVLPLLRFSLSRPVRKASWKIIAMMREKKQ